VTLDLDADRWPGGAGCHRIICMRTGVTGCMILCGLSSNFFCKIQSARASVGLCPVFGRVLNERTNALKKGPLLKFIFGGCNKKANSCPRQFDKISARLAYLSNDEMAWYWEYGRDQMEAGPDQLEPSYILTSGVMHLCDNALQNSQKECASLDSLSSDGFPPAKRSKILYLLSPSDWSSDCYFWQHQDYYDMYPSSPTRVCS
jgi:hypothetical protein